MNLITVITHLGIIGKCVRDVESVVATAIKSKSVPDKGSWNLLLDDVKSLVDAGLIQLPGIDQKVIDDGIVALEGIISSL